MHRRLNNDFLNVLALEMIRQGANPSYLRFQVDGIFKTPALANVVDVVKFILSENVDNGPIIEIIFQIDVRNAKTLHEPNIFRYGAYFTDSTEWIFMDANKEDYDKFKESFRYP